MVSNLGIPKYRTTRYHTLTEPTRDGNRGTVCGTMDGHPASSKWTLFDAFVKFDERNWKLSGTLSARSRDNLPNPDQDGDNDYVPRNMPAIGDLFDLFDFDHRRD